jgi:hypothetical protein
MVVESPVIIDTSELLIVSETAEAFIFRLIELSDLIDRQCCLKALCNSGSFRFDLPKVAAQWSMLRAILSSGYFSCKTTHSYFSETPSSNENSDIYWDLTKLMLLYTSASLQASLCVKDGFFFNSIFVVSL